MLNHLFFVIVGNEAQLTQLVEETKKFLGIDINVYPALGLGIQCKELLFGIETPEPVSALKVSKILRDISHRDIVVPFCSNVYDCGRIVSRIAISEILPTKSYPLLELSSAWEQVNNANDKRMPQDKTNFAVFEKEGKFFLQVVAGKVPNLDAWQVKFNLFCQENNFCSPCVTTVWLSTIE